MGSKCGCGMRNAECGMRGQGGHVNLEFTVSVYSLSSVIPHSAFRTLHLR